MKSSLKTHIEPTSIDRLSTLVENRQTFDMKSCQLNLFETHQKAVQVELLFDDLVLTSMIKGKKVMHLPNKGPFDYLPGESVVIQPSEKMVIDFPEAQESNPTQCLALAISKQKIQQTVDLLNERLPRESDLQPWKVSNRYFHLNNNPALSNAIDRIVQIGIYEHTNTKDMFADITVQEVLLRLMQTQARTLIEKQSKQLASSHRFAFVDQYIKNHIHDKIDIDQLADKACMSRPNFFRRFKEYFGVTPVEYIQQEKIKTAKEYLSRPETTVSEVALLLGYQNMNHFIRMFKHFEGLTPKQFQIQNRQIWLRMNWR